MDVSVATRICLLGYGEVGQILGDDLGHRAGVTVGAFDLLFDDPASEPSRAARSRRHIETHGSATTAAAGSDVVISAVTASEALRAAESIAQALEHGAYYLDMNSVSPRTKQAVSELIAANGGRFVEAALMSPITHVGPHCPPTLLIQGSHDHITSLDDVRALYYSLETTGVPVVYAELPYVEHAFDLVAPRTSPAAQAALYDVERFLALMA